MFETLKNWWNRDKILQAKLTEKEQLLNQVKQDLTEMGESWTKMQNTFDAMAQQIDSFKQKQADEDAIRNSTEPWVVIKSAKADPVKGIAIELDWNDAFIQYLKDNGLQASSEEILVQKWLAFLYDDLITKLEDNAINTTETGTVNNVL